MHIDDLLRFIFKIINNGKAFNKVYTLAGPEQYKLSEFVDNVAFCLGKKNKPIKIKIPLILFRLILQLNAKLKFSKSLCLDQIDRLIVEKSSDFRLATEDFGFSPIDFKQGVDLVNLN